MNPDKPPPSDDELAREERELAELYAQLPKAEPDAQLDARVLAQARAAVARRTPKRTPRWLVGLGTAAVLVLAAGVTWRLKPPIRPQVIPQAMPEMRGAADFSADAAKNATEPDSATPSRADVGAAAPPGPQAIGTSPDEAKTSASPLPVGSLAMPTARSPSTRSMQKSTTGTAQAWRSNADSTRQRAESAAGNARQAGSANANVQEGARPSFAAPPPTPTAPPVPSERTMEPDQQAVAPMPNTSDEPNQSEVMLVAAAREALQAGDRSEAIHQVRMLVSKYPHFPLPADLAPLAPVKGKDPGS